MKDLKLKLRASVLLGTIILVGAGCSSGIANPITDIKSNTSVKATDVPVSKIYNGKDGFSVSIQGGNTSTCIWTWAGGSAQVPYLQNTTAKTATEKHTITFDDISFLDDFKVNCTDDFGNQYVGVFPTQ